MNAKKPTHNTIKMLKVKNKVRILKAAREKQLVIYMGAPIRLRLLTYFSTETLQARKDCQKIFKVMKSKALQPRLLYPAKLSFKWKKGHLQGHRFETATCGRDHLD